MHKSHIVKHVCADLNSPCPVTSSLYHQHEVLSPTSTSPSFYSCWYIICCTDVSPKPLQDYFSSDFFQQMFPSSQVNVLPSPLSWNSAMHLTYCSATVSMSWRGCSIAHHWSLSAPVRLLVMFSLSNRPPCWLFRLQTHYLGYTKQLSKVPEIILYNCSGVCSQKKN